MGISSSKSNSSSTTQTANNGNYGASATNLGPISTGKKSNVTINALDGGAIAGGLGLASQALSVGQSSFNSAIDAVQSNTASIVDKTLNIANKTQTSESAQFQDTLLKLALVIGAAMVFVAWSKHKKG